MCVGALVVLVVLVAIVSVDTCVVVVTGIGSGGGGTAAVVGGALSEQPRTREATRQTAINVRMYDDSAWQASGVSSDFISSATLDPLPARRYI
jgi:hypothetical protein